MKDRLMKIKNVAEALDCHRRTVERMIAAGILEAVKLPMGGTRVRESQVMALIKQQR